MPITVPAVFPVPQSVSTIGAPRPQRFFAQLDGALAPTDTVTEDHTDMLNPPELALTAEWLEQGARCFNNPFHAPAN